MQNKLFKLLSVILPTAALLSGCLVSTGVTFPIGSYYDGYNYGGFVNSHIVVNPQPVIVRPPVVVGPSVIVRPPVVVGPSVIVRPPVYPHGHHRPPVIVRPPLGGHHGNHRPPVIVRPPLGGHHGNHRPH